MFILKEGGRTTLTFRKVLTHQERGRSSARPEREEKNIHFQKKVDALPARETKRRELFRERGKKFSYKEGHLL